ncbi:MAG: lipid-A-disaccharide synthase [Desulfobulbaceae bacterium]|nr:lipid-A-disaccharide synthase [Desulfobulbaceae bacterium]
MTAKATKEIMIVAGEASGDMHGAALVAAMSFFKPDLHFSGVGDKALAAQGVEILYPSRQLAVVGIIEVLSHWREIRAALNGLTRQLRDKSPSLLILIDFPDFNLILARRAKKLGIPIFYYISPQVWAWRSGRVKTIAQLVDKLAVILPFEKEFYRDRGVHQVEFVGHPLVDSVRQELPPGEFRKRHDIDPKATVVGILPGSRRREITSILPDFIETARLLVQKTALPPKKLCFLLPLAPTLTQEDLGLSNDILDELNIKIITEHRYDLMATCDLVMTASGTVTLELALLTVPMVVTYRFSPLTYRLGRLLVKVKYASLVNLVADKEVVTELIQGDFTPTTLAEALLAIWPGTDQHRATIHGLREVCTHLGSPGASLQAAQLALDLLNERS